MNMHRRKSIILHQSFPDAWQQWSAATDIEIPGGGKVTRLDSMIAVVRAAEQGIGAALVPVPIAEQWFRQKTIVPLFDEPLVTDMSYYLAWSDSEKAGGRTEALRDWIFERFAEDYSAKDNPAGELTARQSPAKKLANKKSTKRKPASGK